MNSTHSHIGTHSFLWHKELSIIWTQLVKLDTGGWDKHNGLPRNSRKRFLEETSCLCGLTDRHGPTMSVTVATHNPASRRQHPPSSPLAGGERVCLLDASKNLAKLHDLVSRCPPGPWDMKWHNNHDSAAPLFPGWLTIALPSPRRDTGQAHRSALLACAIKQGPPGTNSSNTITMHRTHQTQRVEELYFPANETLLTTHLLHLHSFPHLLSEQTHRSWGSKSPCSIT